MKNILTQLFGDLVTNEAMSQFNKELGLKFVAKGDYNNKLEEIKTLKADKDELTNKITELTEKSNSADDYKTQLENLQKQIKEEKEQAEADRKAKEKAEGIASRFSTVLGEKEFNHDAIKAEYLKKFGEALENKDFEGKSDAEIFHELTKDDSSAFKGVTAFTLEGGKSKGAGKEIETAQARTIMGLPPEK